MKLSSLLVFGFGMILSISCSKGKFSEDATPVTGSETQAVVPSGDATSGLDRIAPAAPLGTITASWVGADSDVTTADSAEAAECAAATGINNEQVKVSGDQKTLTMTPQDALALKVTGNQNTVNLKMGADIPGARVAAICLFLAGNESHVTMDIGIKVAKVFIKARGNTALVEAAVSKDGGIENFQVDASGNQPSIVMKGEGSYPCDQASVTCQKP